MSSCSDFSKRHEFDYLSDSSPHSSDVSDYSSDDELESLDDPFAITINAKEMNRIFRHSRYNKVPLSTQINQIIKDYLDWHAHASDAKMLYMPKPWISNILNQLTEQQVSAVARDVSKEFKDICLMLRGEFTITSFLDALVSWFRINGTPNRQVQNPHEFRLLLKHDMGYNYSFLLKEVFSHVIADFFRIETQSTITDNTFALSISMIDNAYK